MGWGEALFFCANHGECAHRTSECPLNRKKEVMFCTFCNERDHTVDACPKIDRAIDSMIESGDIIVVPTKQREGDQPLPVINDQPFVQDAVMAFIEERKQIGIQRYGTPLQPFNGRDWLRDAFEEAVDQAIYLAQGLIERDGHL